MRYAVMSDVHSNPVALRTVLADAREQDVDKTISCGDVTGYGYDVQGTVRLLKANVQVHLMGNHDRACLAARDAGETAGNNNYDVDRRQRGLLSPVDYAWLKRCPYVHAEAGFACAHGDFTTPELFNYVMDGRDAIPSFECREEPLLFVGHTHAAEIYALRPDNVVETWGPRSFDLRPGWRYLVNVGSVGNPRFDYRTTYFIYDDAAKRVYFRALQFDVKSYVDGLMQRMVPMPEWLSDLMLRFRRMKKNPSSRRRG